MISDTTSDECRERFEADGFVALPRFFHGQRLTDLLSHVDRFIRVVVPGLPREHVFYEDRSDPRTLKQIQRMGDHDAWFHQLFTEGPLRKVAELLLRSPVVPKNMQYFNKPPGVGRPTPPHQDGFYFMLEPCQAVTLWLALDKADLENGCVRYIRGSHARGMRRHARTGTLGFSQGIVDFPTDQDRAAEAACPALPGDLLAHHALTIHRADGNRSTSRSRRALGIIYYSERARENADAVAAYRRSLEQAWKAAGRI